MNNTIKCPNCDTEYLPAEIFYPDDLIGKPKDIEKDVYGKLLYFAGSDSCLEEKYYCDYCGRVMTVSANLSFNATTQNFKKTHTTKFKKPSLFMNEED